ncbi:MAG: hypothetical protein EPN70_20465 [Paraburkholderia sp.]|nr:MAG: hypothetical protein EPN70_20465 [Paraburkholderia sp.]TAM30394.1 MAG: hypothetical protein EPN59_09555 [Paraburkholderia sp.]
MLLDRHQGLQEFSLRLWLKPCSDIAPQHCRGFSASGKFGQVSLLWRVVRGEAAAIVRKLFAILSAPMNGGNLKCPYRACGLPDLNPAFEPQTF